MIQYHVRSRYLVDVVNDINAGKIVLSPYFQRKLVWREGHKVDFIKTILLGYPFPEIFLSRGNIDLEDMTSRSSLVDGQQRMNSICEFVTGKFRVDEKTYHELTPTEKESFLKYEIAIIDLDLSDNDANIIDIFKRLNRTFYALSNIEKMATEFASSEFMLTAKLLSGELPCNNEGEENVDVAAHELNPNLTEEFIRWANTQEVTDFKEFILGKPIFSKYEISRNVHLMFTLNLMATQQVGYYNRNERVIELLELYAQAYPDREIMVSKLNSAARLFTKLRLKAHTFWYGKSNAFSLLSMIAERQNEIPNVEVKTLKTALDAFAETPPADYSLAAKEAVNNKRERILRKEKLETIILPLVS